MLEPGVQACIRRRGFTSLSDAQQQAIPLIHDGNNIVLIAPTGTGKTESAMFPVFNGLLSLPAGGGIQGPLHHAAPVAQPGYAFPDAVVVQRTGPHGRRPARGYTAMAERRKQALHPPGPPHHNPRDLPGPVTWENGFGSTSAHVKYVIIDEIHELAASKRGAQLAIGLERLVALCRRVPADRALGNGREPGGYCPVPLRHPALFRRAGTRGKTAGDRGQVRGR